MIDSLSPLIMFTKIIKKAFQIYEAAWNKSWKYKWWTVEFRMTFEKLKAEHRIKTNSYEKIWDNEKRTKKTVINLQSVQTFKLETSL